MLQQVLQFGEHLPAVTTDQNIRVACKNREQKRQRRNALSTSRDVLFCTEEKERGCSALGGPRFVQFRATRQQIARSIN